MSRVTGIQYIQNDSDSQVTFTNHEDSGNNRLVPATRRVGVGNAWVPWREDDQVDMVVKRMVVKAEDGTFEYTIWQHGEHIRCVDGEDPKTAAGGELVPGDSYRGSSKNLVITRDGTLLLEQC